MKDYKFFKEHAGYCVGHRAEGALSLARAERMLELKEHVKVVWEYENCPSGGPKDWGWPDKEIERFWQTDHEVMWAALYVDGEVEESLGDIWDPDDNYQRVVNAELMSQYIERVPQQEEMTL